MPTYQELMAQIAELQQQAEETRRTEVALAITDIKEKIVAYGLTAADLGLTDGVKGNSTGRTRRSRGTVAVKYKDPVSGATWSGRGVMPKWLQTAVAAGKSKDEYLV
jgi:DNA-binding protein H-NS